jgi:hypothetical protein
MSKIILILCVFIVLFSSCYYDVEEELYPQKNNCDLSDIKYSTKIKSIVLKSCALSGCHIAGAQQPDLSDYNKLNANVSRVNARAVVSKTMPPSGPMNACDIEALKAWIDGGAINN